jgi:putative component of toxin-antitoxin plasmid stabilization module
VVRAARARQAKEVPEVVRVLIAHMNAGRRTYVYGTAGVNRTAYALVLMLCFFDKMEMEDAIVQAAKLRPQAKNNTDLWLVRLTRNRGDTEQGC